MEGKQLKVLRLHVDAGRQYPIQPDRGFPGIPYPDASCDYIHICKYTVRKHCLYPCNRILCHNFQCVTGLAPCGRHPLQMLFPLVNAMGDIPQFQSLLPFLCHDVNAAFTKIPGASKGIFHRKAVKERHFLPCIAGREKRRLFFTEQIAKIPAFYSPPVINMTHIFTIGDTNHITGVWRIQPEDLLFFHKSYHRMFPLCFILKGLPQFFSVFS